MFEDTKVAISRWRDNTMAKRKKTERQTVRVKLPNSEQSYKGKVKTHILTDKISQQPENCENRNDPDLV